MQSLKAVLFFHVRVGVRLALQSSIPIFCALLVVIMIDIDPIATVRIIARQVFMKAPSTNLLAMIAVLAFALPAWAVPRMITGLNGWLRHLPIGSIGNRRGIALALLIVQAPLATGLGILAVAAHQQGIPVFHPILLKLALLLTGAACAVLPSKHRFLSGPLACGGALLGLFGHGWVLAVAVALLVTADAVSGPVCESRGGKRWRNARARMVFRIEWRALRWRLMLPYAAAMTALGITALFITNNKLTGAFYAGAGRFGVSLAGTLFLTILFGELSARRPVWPWARSLPRSSLQRVLLDAIFLAAHAAPLAILLFFFEYRFAVTLLLLLPLLSFRAVEHMRRMPERRMGSGPYLAEGFALSGLIALLPWSVLAALAIAPVALLSARNTDSRQKVTRWLEKHHETVGDPLSWSAR
jgi:hypothetical protein